jgi:hypothetical protein
MNLAPQSVQAPPVDPITVEVIGSALASIAEEMGETLVRAAHSTNIKERRDICHVAHGVAAGFASGNTNRTETTHDRWCVVDVNEMELPVLTGGDVRDAVRILLRQFRHDFELFCGGAAIREFDP